MFLMLHPDTLPTLTAPKGRMPFMDLLENDLAHVSLPLSPFPSSRPLCCVLRACTLQEAAAHVT